MQIDREEARILHEDSACARKKVRPWIAYGDKQRMNSYRWLFGAVTFFAVGSAGGLVRGIRLQADSWLGRKSG
jgi:hypothetical protein